MTFKTLHLTNAWHERSGGVATFYRALMQAADEIGQEIRLIVPATEDRIENVGSHGKVYHLRAPSAPLNSSYRLLYPTEYLSASSRIQAILRDEQPDVIEISDKYNLNYLGGLLRSGVIKIGMRPTVVAISNERMDENFAAYLGWGAMGKAFSRWYMRWCYFPMFDHHIANSLHTAAELRQVSEGHPVQRGVWVRPMGVDLERFSMASRNAAERERLWRAVGGREDSVLLLYVGRLAPEKNLSLLAEMMEHLRDDAQHDYRLLIVGSGVSESDLKARLQRCALGRFAFLGHTLNRDELANIYANGDVFIHPNPREPFGIAPLEAMASGLPLVVPNAGGVLSYATPANSWICPPEAHAFAHCVREIVADPQLRIRKTEAARQTAERFRWPQIARSYLELFSAIHSFTQSGVLPERLQPLFWSTPSSAGRGALVRGTAKVFERGMVVASRLGILPDAKR